MRSRARHVLALTTTGLLAWFGLSLITARPVVGWLLLGLAGFRLGAWIASLVRARRASD